MNTKFTFCDEMASKVTLTGAEVLDTQIHLDYRYDDLPQNVRLLEAVSLPYVGPNLHLAPDSKVGDGHFSVIAVTKAERARLVDYLENWKEDREDVGFLPSLRGRRLQLDWSGFPLHIDDKLMPKHNAKPKEIAGPVEVRIGCCSVEFLIPGDPKAKRAPRAQAVCGAACPLQR